MGLAAYNSSKYWNEAYKIYAETLQVDGLGFSYKNKIKDQYNTIVENIKTQNEFTPDFKRDLIEFLTKALDRMIEGLKQDYKLADSSFTPNLEKSETFNNEHQVIKKNNKK